MAKQIIYDNEAKQKILAGIEKLNAAVSTTLGPCGKNVIIDEYGSIHSTKDGVTVAKSITLKDPFENLGANAIKEVASKSNDKVGDGTTTSTLLAAAIYKQGLKYVGVGANATQVKNGIKKAADAVIERVKSYSKPVSSKEDIKRVCTVSANGDEKIGELISDVMDKIGKDGMIKVEDGQTAEMTSKIVEGMVIDNGYVSPWMVTSQETMEAELDNPFVLLVNKKISNIQAELFPLLQQITQQGQGRPLLIIADDFADEVTATIVMNKMRGSLNCVCVKSPSYGDNRKHVMEDIAILVGGKVCSDENGVKPEHATLESGIVGAAKRVLISKDQTIIFDGFGDKDTIEARAEALRIQIENAKTDFDKHKLQERLGKLTNGIGIIQVGADTEAERKELRDRVDDAFAAAKAAVKGGIVAGGGTALFRAKQSFDNWFEQKLIDGIVGDEAIGVRILFDSLEAPLRKIISNAGVDPSYIISKLFDKTEQDVGYNVLKKDIVNMFDDGVIDPTDVVVNEVRNASSVAGLLLTTDALIVEEPKKDEHCNCGQPQMPMM